MAGFESVGVGLDEDFPGEGMVARPEFLVVGVLIGPAEGFVAFGEDGLDWVHWMIPFVLR